MPSDDQSSQRIAELNAPSRWKLALRDDDDDHGDDDRAQEHAPRHGTDAGSASQVSAATCTSCVPPSLAPSSQVVVDEGQMVAEEDPIAVIDDRRTDASSSPPRCRASSVSSTSRRAHRWTPGEVIALIDES